MPLNCRNRVVSSANIWQVAQAHGLRGADAGCLNGGVVAVQDVDVLGVVAAGDTGDSAVRDVGAGN
jgi:hypothetical protein